MAHWREDLNPEIKGHFEKLVNKSAQHKESYEKAKDKVIAQLWTANAIQAKEIDDLRLKTEVLEKAITSLSEKGKIAEQAALKAKFLEKALVALTGKKLREEDQIDANKAMREVISRRAPVKAETVKEEEELETEDTEEESGFEDTESAEDNGAEKPLISNDHGDNILCSHPEIVKEPGFLHYINKEGHLTRVPMARGANNEKAEPEVLHECGIKREPAWLYYVDKKMNSSRAKMARKDSKKE